MTTFHTFDIDSLPAPSDIELEAADRNNTIARVQSPKESTVDQATQYTFWAFVRAAQINLDQQPFYVYAISKIPISTSSHTMTYREWMTVWEAYCEADWEREAVIATQDARDLRDTQQDALT